MRPIDLIYNIAFLHIRLIWDMEVRFSSINITSRLRASFVTETVVVVWLYYKPFGAKRFFHHSHAGLQFTSSAYCYFVALCLFHSVLYSVRVLYLVLILYPVRSPRFILTNFCSRKILSSHTKVLVGGAVASWLVRSTPFVPWPGTLCCVLGQDALSHGASLHPGV